MISHTENRLARYHCVAANNTFFEWRCYCTLSICQSRWACHVLIRRYLRGLHILAVRAVRIRLTRVYPPAQMLA